jgi:predicted aspartyl protease
MFFLRGEKKFPYGDLPHTDFKIPELTIEIRSPREGGRSGKVKAFLDTGADRTFIPESIITRIGEEYFDYGVGVEVKGAGTAKEDRPTYIVNLGFAGSEIRDIEVVSIESQYALIGRDILNKHTVVLNGRKDKWLLDIKSVELE